MSPWVIDRLGSEAEVDEVLAIEQASFTNPWTRQMYLAELENPDISWCYLARTPNGQAIGFCSFWLVMDELHINNLAVLPEFRRAGVATALLMRVLDEGAIRGARRATLEVRRSNEAAQALYAGLGFVVASVRRQYYSHPVEDALVLERQRPSDR
jgi:[ribosomal protein S18]-alanine N-acetyltransferase